MVRTVIALAVSVLLGAGAALAQDAKGKGSPYTVTLVVSLILNS
jgi:hypothetical protein